jgi:UDP-GlcNAc:undecaprenyl-phosphate/decaprenyl-phosphate GlcNAc-1-phosphate transferase
MNVLYFLSAFVTTALVCFLLARCAPSLHLVDRPDERKRHGTPIPVVGGIGIVIGFFLAAGVAGRLSSLQSVVGPMLLMFLLGLVDDVSNLSAKFKLLVQIFSSWWLIQATGASLYAIPIPFLAGHIDLGYSSVPLTMLMIVAVINAINMIDGLDGLAGGCIVVASAALGLAAYMTGRHDLAVVAILLSGALLGFLLWNARFPWQPRAKIFLGDAGALAIGVLLCWLVLKLSLTYVPVRVPLTVVLAPLAVPVIDMMVVAFWRAAEGRNPMQADRGHSHHLLLEKGMSPEVAVRVIWLMAALIAGVTFAAWRLGVQEGRLLGVLVLCALTHLIWFRLNWLALRRSAGK